MKSYPKIEYYNKGLFGSHCYSFDKIDGSNLRFEFNRKRGWYKFGTRNNMMDRSYLEFGSGIDIFIEKYNEDLLRIFTDKYKKVESFVVFGEYVGEGSFAGQHLPGKKDVILFDVNQYKRGFIPPDEFIRNFGHLDIPRIIYEGPYTTDLIEDVKSNIYNLNEGVVVKGTSKSKKSGESIWSVKIKTVEWIKKVENLFGMSKVIEELNGDKSIINSCLGQ